MTSSGYASQTLSMQTLSSEDSASVRSLDDSQADVTSSVTLKSGGACSSVAGASEQSEPSAEEEVKVESESETVASESVETTKDVHKESESSDNFEAITSSQKDESQNDEDLTTRRDSESDHDTENSEAATEEKVEGGDVTNDQDAIESKVESKTNHVESREEKATTSTSESTTVTENNIDDVEIDVKVQANSDQSASAPQESDMTSNHEVNSHNNDVTKPEMTLPVDPVKLRKGGMLDMTSPRMASALKQARRESASKSSKPTPMKATHRPMSSELAMVAAQDDVNTSSGHDTGEALKDFDQPIPGLFFAYETCMLRTTACITCRKNLARDV